MYFYYDFVKIKIWSPNKIGQKTVMRIYTNLYKIGMRKPGAWSNRLSRMPNGTVNLPALRQIKKPAQDRLNIKH